MSRTASIQKGFTLIEVMVATIVLGIAFVGSTSLIVHTRKAHITARQRRMAMAVAETTMEQHKTAPTLTTGTTVEEIPMGNYTFTLISDVETESQKMTGANGFDYDYYVVSVTVTNESIPPVHLETLRRKL